MDPTSRPVWFAPLRATFGSLPRAATTAALVLFAAGCSSADDGSDPGAAAALAPSGATPAPGAHVADDDATEEGDPSAPPARPDLIPVVARFVDPTSSTTPPPPKGPYAHLDPAHVVPPVLLARAVAFFDANKGLIKNQKAITVVDFSRHSGKKRLFVVDLKTGAVRSQVVAHGKMSDPNATGYASTFSNVSGSNMSSLGYALTGDEYIGTHGRSLRLHGLSPTNSNMYSRAIVVHSATYVIEGQAKQGRSLGCFVLDEAVKDDIVDIIEGGSLLYADLAP